MSDAAPQTFSQQYRSVKVTFDTFRTQSPKMAKCVEKAKSVAGNDATVLLLGETGTGKNFLAQAIHNASHRASGPFALLTCTGIPETLMESELFGHKKGAFTGAVSDRVGVFALGDGGTVFIDEIGDLSLVAQAKVLQMVEYKQFKRVGSEKTEHVDARLVCATNRAIDRTTTRADRFREDLFYRLYEVPIQVPPLRERREDLPLLIETFLAEANRKYKKEVKGVTIALAEFFQAYHWPGNVRELRGVIRGGVAQAKRDRIGFEDVPCKMAPSLAAAALDEMDLTIASMEKRHIIMVLEMHDWVKSHAADALGINRSTLNEKFDKLGIVAPKGRDGKPEPDETPPPEEKTPATSKAPARRAVKA